MLEPAAIVGLIIGVALLAYAVTGGADFGGGLWTILAFGPRREQQRRLIERAIAPIWEVNHIWMILVVVLMFVCFPKAFAMLSIALHIPITLMLIGIVLRGTALTFHSYGLGSEKESRQWQILFAVSSLITPVMLGVCVAAIVSGRLEFDSQGLLIGGFYTPWFTRFGAMLGGLFLSICAYLAAVYLCIEADGETELQDDFRMRVLWANLVFSVLAMGCLGCAKSDALHLYTALLNHPLGMAVIVLGGVATLASIYWAIQRRYKWLRATALLQVVVVFAGWGLSQYPYMVYPSLTITNSAAPESILWGTIWILLSGLPFLLAALWWLYRTFSGFAAERAA